MSKTDVEKLQEAVRERYRQNKNRKRPAKSADASARMLEILAQGAIATAGYQTAIQLAKLNENIEKLRQAISVGNALNAGDGYPER